MDTLDIENRITAITGHPVLRNISHSCCSHEYVSTDVAHWLQRHGVDENVWNELLIPHILSNINAAQREDEPPVAQGQDKPVKEHRPDTVNQGLDKAEVTGVNKTNVRYPRGALLVQLADLHSEPSYQRIMDYLHRYAAEAKDDDAAIRVRVEYVQGEPVSYHGCERCGQRLKALQKHADYIRANLNRFPEIGESDMEGIGTLATLHTEARRIRDARQESNHGPCAISHGDLP